MSIVNMSVDTKTRQVAVTVDGILVPAIECHLHKFTMSDGSVDISLSYTVRSESDSGLVETRRFSLPDPKDAVLAVLNENGLISNIELDSEVFASQLQDFLKRKKMVKSP